MAFTPTAGNVALMKLSLTGGTSDTVIPGVDWKLDADAKVANTSNFRDGRRADGTLPDATLSVTLVWDAGEQPTKAATTGIRLGVKGTAKCYTDATHFFSVPVTCSKIGPENRGVEDVVMMPVEFQLNGDLVYPTDP